MKRLGRLASRPAVSLFSTPKLWACSLARHCSSAPAASRVPAVTLLPGDGIGREIAAAVMRVFEVAGSPVEWEVVDEFAQPQEDGEMVIRPEAIASIQRNGVCLKGPYNTPKGVGHVALHQQLRKGLNLYANVRPARTLLGAPTPYTGVDIVTIRENTEGEYSGLEHEVVDGVVENLKIITAGASMRIARFAFEYAMNHQRKQVTVCHKAGMMKLSDGLFLECCREVAKEYPTILYEEQDMDRLCLLLTSQPSRFDVLCMPNLYGDIASDLAAGLVGGLGLVPSANIGDGVAVFESVHGTAPDIAGQDKGNPSALLLCSVLMLQHLGFHDTAKAIEQAVVDQIASQQSLTVDMGGNATCSAFTDALCARIRDSDVHKEGSS